jgi:hypothetical protein
LKAFRGKYTLNITIEIVQGENAKDVENDRDREN